MRRFLLFLVLVVMTGLRAATDEYRPLYHFSPKQNWTNDPNGLIFFRGDYNLFFQFNPFGDKWGHMSWGHAVSRDLIRWNELPVALHEEHGIMMFTGSTVFDEKNTSGLCNAGGCLVAIYTGHTPETKTSPALQTQNIADSNDGGRTWTKYSGNPVLNLHLTDFRDPKVFWSRAGDEWVMAVSLPNDHKVSFYGSKDLKSWKHLSDFGPAGATGGQWECPEIFELPVDLDTSQRKRFVLKVGLNPGSPQGGSGEQYFIGDFDGTRFKNGNPPGLTLLTDHGKDCYCALTFNNLPAGQETVMMGWMDNWDYAAELPTSPWRGQMTIPRTVGLRTTAAGVRLVQAPIPNLQKLRTEHIHFAGRSATALNQMLARSSIGASQTYEIESTVESGEASDAEWRVLVGSGSYTAIGYSHASKSIFVDRTRSGEVGFSPKFPTRTAARVQLDGGRLQFRILVDRNSVEVFSQNGEITLTNLVFPPRNAAGIELLSPDGAPIQADIWKLELK